MISKKLILYFELIFLSFCLFPFWLFTLNINICCFTYFTILFFIICVKRVINFNIFCFTPLLCLGKAILSSLWCIFLIILFSLILLFLLAFSLSVRFLSLPFDSFLVLLFYLMLNRCIDNLLLIANGVFIKIGASGLFKFLRNFS